MGNQSFGSLWNLLRAPTQCSGTGTFCQVCTLAPGHLLSSRDGAFGSHLEHPQSWWKRRLHSWVARVWVRDPGPQCVALPSAEQSLVPGYRALLIPVLTYQEPLGPSEHAENSVHHPVSLQPRGLGRASMLTPVMRKEERVMCSRPPLGSTRLDSHRTCSHSYQCLALPA